MDVLSLKKIAAKIRREILYMIYNAQSGHPGSSLSCADILTTLYFGHMRLYDNPKHPDRDRFILSKGHACPALYATLIEKGYLPREARDTLRMINSMLQGHPDMNKAAGVDMTTGSLGQGLSVGVGMALAAKLDKKDYITYVLLGDGELNEGQIWEAIMSAVKYKLSNLCIIVDLNGLQIDGTTEEVMPMSPIKEKFDAFGVNVIEVDGHDHAALLNAFGQVKVDSDRPTCILAHTIKGKGVSFMENQCDWHGKPPNDKEYAIAMEELR